MPIGGLQLASVILTHEATDPVDLDLSALADYATEFHGPGVEGKCRGCAQPWGGAEWDGWPNGLPCQEWLEIRSQINERIMQRVLEIVRRNRK